MSAPPAPLHGGCHCGKLTVALATGRSSGTLHPRACDCTFCTKHGAAWVSDAGGRMAIVARDPATLAQYRQGGAGARFLLCRDCGVLVAVVHEGDDGLRGAVNARCLDDARLPDAVAVSPQRLSPDEKRARWTTLWSPATLDIGNAPA